MIFGPDGLKRGLIKMFLDPFHQSRPGPGYDFSRHAIAPSTYDHTTTTRWMRYFVRQGLERTRARGDDLSILTALYSPPGWMTEQGFLRGRDLNPDYKYECAKYMIAWVEYLRRRGSPSIISCCTTTGRIGNDGPWTEAGRKRQIMTIISIGHRNRWSIFLAFIRPMLDARGLSAVGISPGETSNWFRFHHHGYAQATAEDVTAMENLGLMTSHGFFNGQYGRWYGDHRSAGDDILREGKPDLHSWVTSTSWSDMDVFFQNELYGNIYSAKVKGIIPWLMVQTDTRVGGDPNPGTAFRVDGERGYSVEKGYDFYKQVCRAGQRGMAIAGTGSNDPEITLMAFASNGTKHPSASIVLNLAEESKELKIDIEGAEAAHLEGHRTSPDRDYLTGHITPERFNHL